MQELTLLLRRSVPMDELWKVARGEIKYQDYMKQAGHLLLATGAAGAVKEIRSIPEIPQDLVSLVQRSW